MRPLLGFERFRGGDELVANDLVISESSSLSFRFNFCFGFTLVSNIISPSSSMIGGSM